MTNNTIQPTFTINKSLESWNIPSRDWLIKNKKEKQWNGLASGTIVFNNAGKILMIQRASHDSMPNRWEIPGGAIDDDEDATIFHGAARELWEEAGLVVRRFTDVVPDGPGRVFPNSAGTRVYCQFTFHVEVDGCDGVKLDPNEHQAFVWASEEEVREQRIGEMEFHTTTPQAAATILEAFKLRKG